LPADVVAIIVAAGESRRLGQPKQLLPWRDSTLLAHAVTEAAAVCERVIVVTGAARETVENAVPADLAECVFNPDWRVGMGTSIAAGVRLADDADAALLLLCDQPLIGRDDLAALLALWQNAPAVPAAAAYAGAAGVPAVFPRSWFARLTALRGDHGARALLRDNNGMPAAAIPTLEMPSAATDIDTLEDLERLG